LATTSWDTTARLWDVRTGQEVLALKGHADMVFAACFSRDGRRLATAARDGSVRLWDARPGQEFAALLGHPDRVGGVAFNPDGTRVATASHDRTARVWDARSGQELLVLKGHTDKVWEVCFSPDGKRLATSSQDRTKRLWDTRTGQQLPGAPDFPLQSDSVSPDGRSLALIQGNKVRLIDLRLSEEHVAPPRGPPRPAPAWHAAEAKRLERDTQPGAARPRAFAAGVPAGAVADLDLGLALARSGHHADAALALLRSALHAPEDDFVPAR